MKKLNAAGLDVYSLMVRELELAATVFKK